MKPNDLIPIKFINLTPHAIKEVNSGLTIPPSGEVARVSVVYKSVAYKKVSEKAGIPFFKAEYGEVEGIPAPQPSVLYIVSGLVFEATDRTDVIAPGELVRDKDGKPIGCNGFKTKTIL